MGKSTTLNCLLIWQFENKFTSF